MVASSVPLSVIPPYTLLLFFHCKLPESADENVFTVLQGLFYQLEQGVDDLGRLGLSENAFGEKFLHKMGFGQSHSLLQHLNVGK
jgi:hypothetical protein